MVNGSYRKGQYTVVISDSEIHVYSSSGMIFRADTVDEAEQFINICEENSNE